MQVFLLQLGEDLFQVGYVELLLVHLTAIFVQLKVRNLLTQPLSSFSLIFCHETPSGAISVLALDFMIVHDLSGLMIFILHLKKYIGKLPDRHNEPQETSNFAKVIEEVTLLMEKGGRSVELVLYLNRVVRSRFDDLCIWAINLVIVENSVRSQKMVVDDHKELIDDEYLSARVIPLDHSIICKLVLTVVKHIRLERFIIGTLYLSKLSLVQVFESILVHEEGLGTSNFNWDWILSCWILWNDLNLEE